MSLTIEQELFKVGYEGVVADFLSPYVEDHKKLGFETGTKIKIIDNCESESGIGLFRCQNDSGFSMLFHYTEILITKVKL